VKNNKPYHKIFATWANREGYKSVAPALQRAGNLDTEALDYWTPDVWKIYWAEVRGIDWEMPPEWSKERIPEELRDYLETVFDAYDRIVFDWPTEYRQIGEQGMAEGEDNIPQQRTDKIRERFGRSFARKYAKELAEKVFAEHPKLTSYNLVQRYAFAIAIQELGSRQRLNWLMYDTDFASDILDAYVKLRGLPPIKQGMAEDRPVTIGSRLPKSDIETFGLEPSRGYKINNPKDWKQGDRPRAVQQLIPTQDKKDHIRSRLGKHVDPVLPEAKDDYVPPKEAKYGPEYQAMVKRVGQKAKQQEKAKQQQPKAPVRESRKALLKQIIQS
jgi:hypothetical protein